MLVLARMLHRYDLAGDASYQLGVAERLTPMPRGLMLTAPPRVPATVGST